MSAASNIEQTIEKYPGTFSLATATSLIELISDDATLFSESSRQQMIDKVNAKLAMEVDHYDDTLLPVAPTVGKQTMLQPENYFTDAIWRGLLDDEASQAEVYMQICAVLVRCGFSRPQETFWGILVATLQWGSNNPNFDAGQVRDSMKRMWKNFRFIIPTIPDAPTEYPTMPSKLLDTHPELYHRAYPVHPPVPPPSHLEPLKLSWLRSTTGSRCTKRPLIGAVAKQWHVMALETMLVFGKMCP